MSHFFEWLFERNGSPRSGSPQRAINPISNQNKYEYVSIFVVVQQKQSLDW